MPSDRGGMTTIVRVVSRWLIGLVFIYGFGVALFGHLTPGGGFAGGVILACGLVLSTLAFGGRRGPAKLLRRWLSSIDAAGALAFVVLALLGYTAAHFFQQWLAKGELFELGATLSVVLMNLAILFKVGAGLFAAFLLIAVFGRGEWSLEGKEEAQP